ncbi:hypothetical protein MKK68_20070 [Methylobacterium sp. E-016]|uniref:hypothetical protein n=1 Tax=Methylobacterium sp. E-016 TaxID=2836556 RepID=UPI001FBA0E96|nr:hypothetical protein [Methylobacterium sp. E-016]MCJ2077911.1 hypothetical protein [Methylobacterium sp. E-016]
MRSFDSPAAFAAFLQGVARTVPQAEHKAMETASAHHLAEVQKIPGRYHDGWASLADATKADRVRKGFPEDEPLLRTGALRKSYKRRVINARLASVGSNDPRAPLFENGTSKMPPRPVLGTAAKQDGKNVAEIIGQRMHRHLLGGSVED